MTHNGSNEYLRNAVMTATPEQLQLMLYDGAIRFARQARKAIMEGDRETSCEKLIRAQKILIEMRNGLRHEVNPELCKQLAALYDFIYDRLVNANMRRDTTAIDEALEILHHQRETWQMLIDKILAESSSPPADPVSSDASQETGAVLSIEG